MWAVFNTFGWTGGGEQYTGTITGSGTTNYAAKFTGASVIGDSQIFDNGTFVGVNANTITSASERFQVKTATNSYGIVHTDGTRIGTTYVSSAGFWLGTKSNDSLLFFFNDNTQTATIGLVTSLGLSAGRGMLISASDRFVVANRLAVYDAGTIVRGTTADSTASAIIVQNSSATSLINARNDGLVTVGGSNFNSSTGLFDSTNRLIKYSSTITAMDFASFVLYDTQASQVVSVDFGARTLKDSAGSIAINFQSDIVKIRGTNSVADMAGTDGNDLRIIGDSNGTNAKGIYIKAYNGTSWRTGLQYLNVNSGEPNICLATDGFGKVGIGTASPNTMVHVNGSSSFLATTSSAASLTLGASTAYVFTGTTTTWTLPAVSGNTSQFYFIKNRGSGAITLNTNAGGTDLYTTVALASLTINAGEAYILINDGTYWLVN